MRPSDYLKKGWCRRSYALDVYGNDCGPRHPDAASWCLVGSVRASGLDSETRTKLRMALATAVGTLGDWARMEVFNDNPDRTQQECIDVMLKAEKEVFGDEQV